MKSVLNLLAFVAVWLSCTVGAVMLQTSQIFIAAILSSGILAILIAHE